MSTCSKSIGTKANALYAVCQHRSPNQPLHCQKILRAVKTDQTLREMMLQSNGSWTIISQVTNPNITRHIVLNISAIGGGESKGNRGSGEPVAYQECGSIIGNTTERVALAGCCKAERPPLRR